MILGIDVSSRDVAVILANADGGAQVALRSGLPREGGAPAIWLAAMETARETMLRAQVVPGQIARVGVAFGAPLDEHGVIGKSARAVGWEGFNLPEAVRQHLGIAAEIVAENRVICEAHGEWRFGALRPTPENACLDWLFVHLGDTIAGVAAASGHLLRGAARAATEIGAICIDRDGPVCASGRRGCLEAYCGGEAFLTRARSYGQTFKSAREVWDVYDEIFAARSLCDDYVVRLAQGLGIALTVLNPRRVVMGGHLANSLGEKLLAPLRGSLKDFCLPAHYSGLELCSSQLGNDAAVMGTIAIALDK